MPTGSSNYRIRSWFASLSQSILICLGVISLTKTPLPERLARRPSPSKSRNASRRGERLMPSLLIRNDSLSCSPGLIFRFMIESRR